VQEDGVPAVRHLAGVSLVSATLLMIELCLTRIFSVVMYYHFAFLAISIALFGLSASGVFAFVSRRRLDAQPADRLLSRQALIYAACTIVSLFVLVRLRVTLQYSPRNLALMLAIYLLAAIPFFTGGLVVTLAIARLTRRITSVYAADLTGAAAGCLLLIPLLDRLGAPGVVLAAAALACAAGVLFAPAGRRARIALAGTAIVVLPLAAQATGTATFDVTDTKGHRGDRVLFSKWNSFSRVGVYERAHGDWSLSPAYAGPRPESRFMDIDSAASTPILRASPDLSNVHYLRYELTALAYRLEANDWDEAPPADPPPFTALVIGPGGGRDLASALVFGAAHVDGIEINPIIANDVMRRQFLDFSGGLYTNPRVRIAIDDGRSFVRRSTDRYDVIQASLVDTWAATAAGAYTLTENTLYTVEAFNDYLDHLTDRGVLSITRWTFDGLRLVSLAQAACRARGWEAAPRLAVIRSGQVATFLLKKSPFTPDEARRLVSLARALQFDVLYAPGEAGPDPDEDNDYARLITAPDADAFIRQYAQDIRPTTDDRPFFFHTTKLRDQFQVAFGRSMLFGNGLSALLTLLGISTALIALFILGPLVLAGGWRTGRWLPWLAYFGALGAGFMLIEVSVLQEFVLLLGHPVYSLTVTLFSLLLGTGLGAALSRRVPDAALRRATSAALLAIAIVAVLVWGGVTGVVSWAMPFSRPIRMAVAVGVLLPIGILLGLPMPSAIRVLDRRTPELLTWAWGMNGALSVLGATLAIFVAMNWGFGTTLLVSSATYLIGLAAFTAASAS
jgi:predicted membrane-bound spermidine synthase